MVESDLVQFLTLFVVCSVWIFWSGSFRWPALHRFADVGNSIAIWLCAGLLALGAVESQLVALLLGQVAIQNFLVRFSQSSN